MYRQAQNCKSVLLSEDRERFDTFMTSFHALNVIKNIFSDQEFLDKFFQTDINFFTHVIQSHQDIETDFHINEYVQKKNMIEHAKIIYTRYENKLVDLTPASLLCFENSLTYGKHLDHIISLADRMIMNNISYDFDIKPFCSVLEKLERVEYHSNRISEKIFCHRDLIKTLQKIMIFPTDMSIDVRYLLVLNNLFGPFIVSLKHVQSFARVFYGDGYIEFKFTPKIMSHLIEKFNLTNEHLLIYIKKSATVEWIDFYYGRRSSYAGCKQFPKQEVVMDNNPNRLLTEEETYNFCRRGISSEDEKKLATPLNIPRSMTIASYLALKNKGIKLIGPIYSYLSYYNNEILENITVAQCEMIDFDHITIANYYEIPRDVFFWLAEHQTNLLATFLRLPYCLYDSDNPYQLSWLFSWLRIHKETLPITELIDFYSQILPSAESLTIMIANTDIIENDMTDFASQFESDNIFWKTLLESFPQFLKTIYPNTDKSTIFVGARTTVDFINYIRENCSLIKFDFVRDFHGMIHENIECCQILEMMMHSSQYIFDFHNHPITIEIANGKNIYWMYKRFLHSTIFNYMKNNDLFTKWKIGFRIKNVKGVFDPKSYENLMKEIPNATIYWSLSDLKENIEYTTIYWSLYDLEKNIEYIETHFPSLTITEYKKNIEYIETHFPSLTITEYK